MYCLHKYLDSSHTSIDERKWPNSRLINRETPHIYSMELTRHKCS